MDIKDPEGISEPLRVLAERALDQYTGFGPGHGRQISVTSVIQPLQVTLITRAHDWEIQAKLTDVTEMLLGQLFHLVLATTGLTDVEQLRAPINDNAGNEWLVGGTPDFVGVVTTPQGPQPLMQDFKVTKTYAARKPLSDEWKRQQDLYRWLFWRNGGDVTNLKHELVLVLKDWSQYRISGKDYPQQPLVKIPVTPWTTTETAAWLSTRLTILEQHRQNGTLPPCSSTENWDGKRCKRCFALPWCGQGQSLVGGTAAAQDYD